MHCSVASPLKQSANRIIVQLYDSYNNNCVVLFSHQYLVCSTISVHLNRFITECMLDNNHNTGPKLD